jgi:hypothetical protein
MLAALLERRKMLVGGFGESCGLPGAVEEEGRSTFWLSEMVSVAPGPTDPGPPLRPPSMRARSRLIKLACSTGDSRNNRSGIVLDTKDGNAAAVGDCGDPAMTGTAVVSATGDKIGVLVVVIVVDSVVVVVMIEGDRGGTGRPAVIVGGGDAASLTCRESGSAFTALGD